MRLKTAFYTVMGLRNRLLPMWKLRPALNALKHALNKLGAEHIFAIFFLSHAVVRDKIFYLYRPY